MTEKKEVAIMASTNIPNDVSAFVPTEATKPASNSSIWVSSAKPQEPYVKSPDNIYMNQPTIASQVWTADIIDKNVIVSNIHNAVVKPTTEKIDNKPEDIAKQNAKISGNVIEKDGKKSVLFNIGTDNGNTSIGVTSRAANNIAKSNKGGLFDSVLGSSNNEFSFTSPKQVSSFLNEVGIGLLGNGISINTLRSPSNMPQVLSWNSPKPTTTGEVAFTQAPTYAQSSSPSQTNLVSSVFETK